MKQALTGIILLALTTNLLAQPARQDAQPTPQDHAAPRPSFLVADVQPSPIPAIGPDVGFSNGGNLHGDRYYIYRATMLDLIATAYDLERDKSKIYGGPSWLERDHFDVVAKVPPNTPAPALRLMLQSLLAQRFHLVLGNQTQPMPAYVLTVLGDKSKLKPSTSETANCHYTFPQSTSAPANGGERPSVAEDGGVMTESCVGIPSETLAQRLVGVAPAYFDQSMPVVDSTGLTGSWDFDVHFTPKAQLGTAGSAGKNYIDSIQKELGLKLELATVPRPVLTVQSVDRRPTPNAPDIAKLLPPPPSPHFEVAVIKPNKGTRGPMRMDNTQFQVSGFTVLMLMEMAWQVDKDDMMNVPKWLDQDRFDFDAKVTTEDLGPNGRQRDLEYLRPMIRSMLADRFHLQIHQEDRLADTFVLTASNPRLHKAADPNVRTRCSEGPAAEGKDTRNAVMNRLITCQNISIPEFLDELRLRASGYVSTRIVDETGLKDRYDISLTFSVNPALMAARAVSAPTATDTATASDPSGAVTLPDALNKQLGLKLDKQKRTRPVLVLDHIDETPTEN